jgi:hypothetical protein
MNSRSGEVLKSLWDRLCDPDDWAGELVAIIEDQVDIDPWRAAIINTPAVYVYADTDAPRILRFQWEGGIYLLKKSQMNGRHVELFTFCLCKALRSAPESLAFDPTYNETSSTADEPSLSLSRRFGEEDVEFRLYLRDPPDGYAIRLRKPTEPNLELSAVLKAEGFEERDGSWVKAVSRDGMRAVVENLDHATS